MTIAKGSLRQVLAASSGCIGCFIIGSCIGYTLPAIASIHDQSDLSPSKEQEYWIGSFIYLGALVGALIAGTAIDAFGRRNTLLYMTLPGFAVSWILLANSVHLSMLFVARFVGGIAGGLTLVTNSVYITEISETKLRGMTGSLIQLYLVMGMLFFHGIGSVTSWSTLAWIGFTLVVPYAAALFFIPESPVWLINEGRFEEAERCLMWLRVTDQYSLSKELRNLKKTIDSEQQNKVKAGNLIEHRIWKPFLIGMVLVFFQQTCGVNAFRYLEQNAFAEAGTSITSDHGGIIVASVEVASTFVASLLVDRVGRRRLLILSGMCLCVSLVLGAVYIYWKEVSHKMDLVDKTVWLPLTATMIFTVGFSLGFGPLPWFLIPEVIPSEVRSMGVSLVHGFRWILCFVVKETYLPLTEGLGDCGTFWLYAGFSVLATLFVFFFLPETKKKSQEEIKELFARDSSMLQRGPQYF